MTVDDSDLQPPVRVVPLHPSQRSAVSHTQRATLLFTVSGIPAQQRVLREVVRSRDDQTIALGTRSGSDFLVVVHCPRTFAAVRAVRALVHAADPHAHESLVPHGVVDLTAPEPAPLTPA